MSYYFDNTGNFYLEGSPIGDSAVEPFTMSVWAREGASASGAPSFCGIYDYSGVQFHQIYEDITTSGFHVESYIAGSASAEATIIDSRWFLGVGRWFSATDRRLSLFDRFGLNADAFATNTTSKAPTGLDRVGVGAAYWSSSVQARCNDIALAHVAIWNAALTDGEIYALKWGRNPRTIRPEALVFYAPLVDDAVDVISGRPLMVEGTPPIQLYEDPPVDPYVSKFHVPLIQVSDAWAAAAAAALTASGTPTADQATATGAANASGVSITDVNTTESWNDGDTGLVITGTGFV